MRDSDNPPPRRRWYQFRLRTLLVVMTLCSLPLAWVASELSRARREREVVALVEKMDGTVSRNWWDKKSRWRSWWQRLNGELFGDPVEMINLSDTLLSDLSPLDKQLDKLDLLTHLLLNETQVSDLSPLVGLKNLESLHLTNTPVVNLAPLVQMSKLKELFLDHTLVSDVAPLAGLEHLNTLWLNDTQVSDLSPLTGLKKLEFLNVRNTRVSSEQVQMLQQALPDCNIRHSVRDDDGENGDGEGK